MHRHVKRDTLLVFLPCDRVGNGVVFVENRSAERFQKNRNVLSHNKMAVFHKSPDLINTHPVTCGKTSEWKKGREPFGPRPFVGDRRVTGLYFTVTFSGSLLISLSATGLWAPEGGCPILQLPSKNTPSSMTSRAVWMSPSTWEPV